MASRRSIAQDSSSKDKDWEVRFDEAFLKEFQAWAEEVQDAILSGLGALRRFGPLS